MEFRSKLLKKSKEEKQSFFLNNGAKMLEQIITSFDGKCNPIQSFSDEELKKATNDYHKDGILRKDMYHTLHKGIHEGREISVKKFKSSSMLEWIINEIAMASYMSNHGKILKLLGCCLETELPILVYEFAGNGLLSDYIGGKHHRELSWEIKLRIATEVANAVAYLHYGASKVVLHRNINTTNVILGEDYVAKLMDFQLAISIPSGKDYVDAEEICGIFGYVAPETLMGRYTEKCDVYSFGIVLLEILTGKRVRSMAVELGTSSFANDVEPLQYGFFNSDEWNKFFECQLMATELGGASRRQLMECAELTFKCLRENPEERPTIKEVSLALGCIKRLQEV